MPSSPTTTPYGDVQSGCCSVWCVISSLRLSRRAGLSQQWNEHPRRGKRNCAWTECSEKFRTRLSAPLPTSDVRIPRASLRERVAACRSCLAQRHPLSLFRTVCLRCVLRQRSRTLRMMHLCWTRYVRLNSSWEPRRVVRACVWHVVETCLALRKASPLTLLCRHETQFPPTRNQCYSHVEHTRSCAPQACKLVQGIFSQSPAILAFRFGRTRPGPRWCHYPGPWTRLVACRDGNVCGCAFNLMYWLAVCIPWCNDASH